ncbi:type II toxin-antitoxin system VapC family toxin [Synechocystis sp. LEGE 06083]|uniref:type II toxin-antitoxin system VapC family toxin n=1 Tax=Synechocystis sp. LEGE 06083 TaxID=915336 RepID=UPI0018830F1C|nr:type II toxin-antitoxin system VapC family toxin [Synechocystis sp. LEGE 06083]MBE9195923.1 type II toxin-antitoxin system VapC family toxin [Synechocystis sp. LEGE 06083]
MKSTVYVETSVISYLAARPSRDVVAAGHQQISYEWWATERINFSLYTSALVLREASNGNPEAASARLEWLQDIPVIAITQEAEALSEYLIQRAALPQNAVADALHIAIAAYHQLNFLLTWNCKHIANAVKRHPIERACREFGFESPILCTPEELLGVNSDVE